MHIACPANTCHERDNRGRQPPTQSWNTTFLAVVVHVVLFRCCNRYVGTIYSTIALWKFPFVLESFHNLIKLFPVGSIMYICSNTVTIAISQTVQRATPNRCATVRYSHGVARHQSVIVTLFFPLIACRNQIFSRVMADRCLSQSLLAHADVFQPVLIHKSLQHNSVPPVCTHICGKGSKKEPTLPLFVN